MSQNDRLYNPVLDLRQISFIINIENQDFELAILSFIISGSTFFYSIFKPLDYDHIIHMTPVTEMWRVVRGDFKQIFNEICSYNNLEPDNFPDILSFISKD